MAKKVPSESEGLDPLHGNGFVIGHVRGVNDRAAELVDGFQPTRYELGILTEHYMNEIGNILYSYEAFMQSGSYEIRFRPFAEQRLGTIQSILGEEEISSIVDPILKKNRADIS
jgi:hypothetical protein